MENRRFHKIECLQTLGTAESERLKVTALNLFHPTASLPSQKWVSSYCNQSPKGEGRGGGDIRVIRYHSLISFLSFLYLTRLATALAALSGVGKFGIPEASSRSTPSSQIPLGAEMQQITGFFSLG